MPVRFSDALQGPENGKWHDRFLSSPMDPQTFSLNKPETVSIQTTTQLAKMTLRKLNVLVYTGG